MLLLVMVVVVVVLALPVVPLLEPVPAVEYQVLVEMEQHLQYPERQ
jgi:hypothetical protein